MIDKIKKYISDRPKLRSALLFVKTSLTVLLILLCVIMSISMACYSCDFAKPDNKSTVSSDPIFASRSADDGLGTWVWNSIINLSNTTFVEYFCDFSSSNFSYIGFAFDSVDLSYAYFDDRTGETTYDFVYTDGWVSDEYRTIDIKTSPPAEFLTILKANATYQGGADPEPEPEPEPEPIPPDTVSSFSSVIPVSASAPFGSITVNSFRIVSTSVAAPTAKWLYDLNVSMQGHSGNIQEYPPAGWTISATSQNGTVAGGAPWEYLNTHFTTYSSSSSLQTADTLLVSNDSVPVNQSFLRFDFFTDGISQSQSVPLCLQIVPDIIGNKTDYVFRWYIPYETGNADPTLNLSYLNNCYIQNVISFDFGNVVNLDANPYLTFPDSDSLAVSPADLIATAYKAVFVTKLAGDNYASGYAAGYAQGVKDTNASNESLLGMRYVYSATEEFLTQPFFGEFSIGGILAAGMGAACLIWLLKLFAGG